MSWLVCPIAEGDQGLGFVCPIAEGDQCLGSYVL